MFSMISLEKTLATGVDEVEASTAEPIMMKHITRFCFKFTLDHHGPHLNILSIHLEVQYLVFHAWKFKSKFLHTYCMLYFVAVINYWASKYCEGSWCSPCRWGH